MKNDNEFRTKSKPNEGFSLGLAAGTYLAAIGLGLGCLFMASDSIWSWEYWGGENLDRSSVVRNIALALLGAIGLPLAIWRSWVAYRQVETANEQIKISQNSMQIERFQNAVEGLDKENNFLLINASIRTLHALAHEDPYLMYEPVIWALVDYISNPDRNVEAHNYFDPMGPVNEDPNDNRDYLDQVIDYEPFEITPTPKDKELAINTLFRVRKIRQSSEIEESRKIEIVLDKIHLIGSTIEDGNMSDILFINSVFVMTSIHNCDLSRSKIDDLHASGSQLVNCNLSDTYLHLERDWNMRGCYYITGRPPKRYEVGKSRYNYTHYENQKVESIPPAILRAIEH